MHSNLNEVLCGASQHPSGPLFPFRHYRCAGQGRHSGGTMPKNCSFISRKSTSGIKKITPHAHINAQKLVVWGMQGKLPAATHYTLQQHTSVVKGPRHPLRVISRSVKLRSALVITLPWLFHSMKAILRELEIGVRCEGEMTPKRENTGNTLEEIPVCVCMCGFLHAPCNLSI